MSNGLVPPPEETIVKGVIKEPIELEGIPVVYYRHGSSFVAWGAEAGTCGESGRMRHPPFYTILDI
jgi:hypothetical protein